MSAGASVPVVGDLTALLGAHEPLPFTARREMHICGCGFRFVTKSAHHRHVAEVIAASGVVVPTVEVRALAAGYDQGGLVPGTRVADRLRALLASRVEGGGS